MGDIVEELRKHHKDIGLSDDVESWLTAAADEIERLREALQSIEDLCNSEIKIRFRSSRMKEEEVAGSSKIYSMLSIPRNIARSALKGGSDDRHC